MTISLPDDVVAMAEERAKDAGFKDVGGFVAALIVATSPQRLDARTEALALEGVASPGREFTKADWDAKVRAFEQRMGIREEGR